MICRLIRFSALFFLSIYCNCCIPRDSAGVDNKAAIVAGVLSSLLVLTVIIIVALVIWIKMFRTQQADCKLKHALDRNYNVCVIYQSTVEFGNPRRNNLHFDFNVPLEII